MPDKTTQKPSTFAEKVRYYREQLGLSQEQVKGFNRQAIYRWEAGLVKPTRRHLHKLASALQIPVEYLLDDEDISNGIPLRSRSLARVEALLLDQQYDAAYEAGVSFARWAYEVGDNDATSASNKLMKEIVSHLDEERLLRAALGQLDTATLRRLSSITNYREQWPLTLIVNELLLNRYVPGTTDHLKMVRNRGVIHVRLGHFMCASQWYRTEMDTSVAIPANVRRMVEMDVATADFLAGKPAVKHPDVAANAQEGHVLWYLYWWYETHAAWRAQDWSGLKIAYRSAYKGLPATWLGTSADIAFAGIDAVLRWRAGLEPLENLRKILLRKDFETITDMDMADDLHNDWIHLLSAMEHPSAGVEWASWIQQMHLQKRDGWLRYWLDHRPSTPIPWEAMPIGLSRHLHSVIEEPPPPFCDPLLQDTCTSDKKTK